MTQFPFLDPNVVQRAKTDYLGKCLRDIEAPLLPIFRHAVSKDHIGQLKEGWHSLRYARVDLWQQLAGSAATAKKAQASVGKTRPDHLLTQRSLEQLRGQLWAIVAPPPDFYRDAVAKEVAAQKWRLQEEADAREQERRLGLSLWQTEYLSFLLGALLETAGCLEETPSGRPEEAGFEQGVVSPPKEVRPMR